MGGARSSDSTEQIYTIRNRVGLHNHVNLLAKTQRAEHPSWSLTSVDAHVSGLAATLPVRNPVPLSAGRPPKERRHAYVQVDKSIAAAKLECL